MRTLRTLVLVAGLFVVMASSAAAAPPSTDTHTNAVYAGQWLATQVTPAGFIESTPGTPDYSSTMQAITALAAVGVGQTQVDAMIAYLAAHVDDAVRSGVDDLPGSLAYLVLAVEATGGDPTQFGTPPTDLVARLEATRHTTGTDTGLYGAQDPTFDGTFRQGFALLALEAAGVTPDATAVSWLEDQQCANDLWVSYRADTSVACVAADPTTFSGPDTNSTASALLGLHAAGDATPVTAGEAALKSVRTASGGWGFIAAPAAQTDANSTGVVLTALRTLDGAADAAGTAALLPLEIGCDGAPADRGAFAYQPDIDGTLTPNVVADVQAIPGIADVALPLHDVAFGAPAVDPCAPPLASTTTSTTATTVASTTSSVDAQVRDVALARTGSDNGALSALGTVLVAGGVALVLAARRRVRAS